MVLQDLTLQSLQSVLQSVVEAVIRKLAHLIYGVIKSGKPFGANFGHSALAIQDGI